MITLYHYTNIDGVRGILKGGKIKKSTGGSAVFGDGVYLTSMHPDEGKYEIALNNYDDKRAFPERQIKSGKLDYVIEFDFDNDDELLEQIKGQGRDVWVYQGDLQLDAQPTVWELLD